MILIFTCLSRLWPPMFGLSLLLLAVAVHPFWPSSISSNQPIDRLATGMRPHQPQSRPQFPSIFARATAAPISRLELSAPSPHSERLCWCWVANPPAQPASQPKSTINQPLLQQRRQQRQFAPIVLIHISHTIRKCKQTNKHKHSVHPPISQSAINPLNCCCCCSISLHTHTITTAHSSMNEWSDYVCRGRRGGEIELKMEGREEKAMEAKFDQPTSQPVSSLLPTLPTSHSHPIPSIQSSKFIHFPNSSLISSFLPSIIQLLATHQLQMQFLPSTRFSISPLVSHKHAIPRHATSP